MSMATTTSSSMATVARRAAISGSSRVRFRALAGSAPEAFSLPRFTVIGHRGRGMNLPTSPDRRMMIFKENSILSFNEAAKFAVDFVEFDVQVTKDGYPIVFHDDFILTKLNDKIYERRVTELHLEEFLSYGPQMNCQRIVKPLYRRSKDGRIFTWRVEEDDLLCMLQDVFQQVDSCLGFNIELKFDDYAVYREEELHLTLQHILQVVLQHAKGRRIIFSTFHPDAAQLIKQMQQNYPVFFLTDGGTEIYSDPRRNFLMEAVRLCNEVGLQGIVSEARGILRHPYTVPKIRESGLQLLTYGQLNNSVEMVRTQYKMGIDGVIVDLVEEITRALVDFNSTPCE